MKRVEVIRIKDRRSFDRLLERKMHCAFLSSDERHTLWQKHQNGQMHFVKQGKKVVAIAMLAVVNISTRRGNLRLVEEPRACESPELAARRGVERIFGPFPRPLHLRPTQIRHEPARCRPEFFGVPVQLCIACFRAKARNRLPVLALLPVAA